MVSFRNLVRSAVAGLIAAGTSASNSTMAGFAAFQGTTAFAVNLPPNSTDMYMTIVSPSYSWAAYGIGSSMSNATMFVFYESTNGSVTLSPRRGNGFIEPNYDPTIDAEILPGVVANGTVWSFTILCRSCRKAADIGPNDSVANFIYAFGPDVGIVSDSPSAGLHQHTDVGTFTLNLKQAVGPGGAPTFDLSEPLPTLLGGTALTGPLAETDRLASAHGFVAAAAVLLLLPASSVIIVVFKHKLAHIISSVLFLLLFLVGFGLGIADSMRYNTTRSMNTGHQVLGIIVTGFFLIMGAIPLIPHLKEYTRLHSWGIHLTFVAAVVCGGLGLQSGGSPWATAAAYVAVVVLVTIVLLTVYWIYSWRRSKGELQNELKRGQEIELQIRRIQELRGEINPPPAYA